MEPVTWGQVMRLAHAMNADRCANRGIRVDDTERLVRMLLRFQAQLLDVAVRERAAASVSSGERVRPKPESAEDGLE